jgi:hypothetical protein
MFTGLAEDALSDTNHWEKSSRVFFEKKKEKRRRKTHFFLVELLISCVPCGAVAVGFCTRPLLVHGCTT